MYNETKRRLPFTVFCRLWFTVFLYLNIKMICDIINI